MSATTEKAILAGGCFWGMQDLIRKRPGVIETRVGYTGGDVANATYRNHGNHAEAIEITFDPSVTSYRELLEFFFQIHDPTTLNRQGNDIGTSYRSAIFYVDDEQRRVAEDTIADVEASGLWPGNVVTEVEPAGPFWEAEPEHQDYLEHYPNGYTCHFPRPGWVLPHRSDAVARVDDGRRSESTRQRNPAATAASNVAAVQRVVAAACAAVPRVGTSAAATVRRPSTPARTPASGARIVRASSRVRTGSGTTGVRQVLRGPEPAPPGAVTRSASPPPVRPAGSRRTGSNTCTPTSRLRGVPRTVA